MCVLMMCCGACKVARRAKLLFLLLLSLGLLVWITTFAGSDTVRAIQVSTTPLLTLTRGLALSPRASLALSPRALAWPSLRALA